MNEYIIIEYTCGEYVTSTMNGSSVLDIMEQHKKKRDWLESREHWYPEDTSEIVSVLKLSNISLADIKSLLNDLDDEVYFTYKLENRNI